jgi:hypothetical protein
LYDLASRDAEIVLLEIGARDSRLLRLRLLRSAQHQSASDRQHRYREDSSCFHVDLLFVLGSKTLLKDLMARRAAATSTISASAERERERFDARVEELDLELSIRDGPGLTDQLIQPLFSGRSVAVGVDVDAVSGARRLAVDAHPKADGRPSR